MKTILFTSTLFWLMAFPFLGDAQSASSLVDKQGKQDKKWIVAWSIGRTLSSPSKDLEEAMIGSGFANRSPLVTTYESFFGIQFQNTYGGVLYPLTTSNKKYMDLHITYYATRKSGISIRYSEAPSANVVGYDRKGEAGNYLTLKTKGTFITLDYVLRTGVRNSGLSVGPALAFHQVDQESFESPETEYHHKSVRPGLHMGYELAVINGKNLFVGLNMNYNWFVKEHIGEIRVGDPNVFTSVFKPAAIRLDQVHLGLTVGLKL